MYQKKVTKKERNMEEHDDDLKKNLRAKSPASFFITLQDFVTKASCSSLNNGSAVTFSVSTLFSMPLITQNKLKLNKIKF